MSKVPNEVTFQIKDKDGNWVTVTAEGQTFSTPEENEEWEKRFYEDIEDELNGLI